MIAAAGASARLDGLGLTFVHGRTTWQVPATAIRAAETGGPDPRPGVMLHLRPGLPLPAGTPPFLFLPARNVHTAEAFRAAVAGAVAAAPVVDAAEVLVTVVVRPSRRDRIRRSAPYRIRIRVLYGAAWLVWFAVVLAVTLRAEHPWATAVLAFLSFWIAPLGCRIFFMGIPARSRPRRTRSLRRLRRHGITVGARITGYRAVRFDAQYFPLLDFTTADGQELQGVVSLRTVWEKERLPGFTLVVYDPEEPALASVTGPREPFAAFAVVLGLVMLAVSVGMLVGGG
ncbi:hypothetical protein B7R87_05600 [Streptomyces tsukubensis]|uniref:DUF3592 domain-containing protein n=1 Tax=Streptomyces tsukubensis (strain DSM 42081 / NBRC 108919 / NRRL 18488 / 9993) TaxID=1114943 RepID=A0A7G3UMK0_STRT9|nr:hypothetical protein B7R87_05600 [Streptomyces tsukubensis]QKM70440.1 hypothetical protein STSU_028220 [Streptomyces tsukubensis NRRL18488]